MSTNVCWICGNAHAANEPCGQVADQRVGTLVENKYQIIRVLGAGHTGTVYEGRHHAVGRRVALKFLLPEFALRPEIMRCFINEARTAGNLDHENIAAVHDFGQTPDGASYLVMDFLSGEDCAELLVREGPLPIERAVGIVLQACRGLDTAHRAGIVHRDLRPTNLFLTKRADGSELVRILDFGIGILQANEPQLPLTRCHWRVPHYQSPEQMHGSNSVDLRTDVYALGVILYELLSGWRPHEALTPPEIICSIVFVDPRPLEFLRSGLPAELARVVRKAMHRDPLQRFANVAELGQALIPFAGVPVAPFDSQPALVPGPVDPHDDQKAAARPIERRDTREVFGAEASPAAVRVIAFPYLLLGVALFLLGIIGAFALRRLEQYNHSNSASSSASSHTTPFSANK